MPPHTVVSFPSKMSVFLAIHNLQVTACQIMFSPFKRLLHLKGNPNVSKDINRFAGSTIVGPSQLYTFAHTVSCNHSAPLPIENNVFGYVTFQNNFTNEKMKKFIW
jgi:hypothetical protein